MNLLGLREWLIEVLFQVAFHNIVDHLVYLLPTLLDKGRIGLAVLILNEIFLLEQILELVRMALASLRLAFFDMTSCKIGQVVHRFLILIDPIMGLRIH